MISRKLCVQIGVLSLALGSSASAQATHDTQRDLTTWNAQVALAEMGGEIPEGMLCLSPRPDPNFVSPPLVANDAGSQADCQYRETNPTSEYDSTVIYEIQVVFHVIQMMDGTGYVSEAQCQSQIDVFNEDFNALPGSLGAPGNDARIRFKLATVDPAGEPTTGVTYSRNNLWFNDGGQYWQSLAWDTNRYMNVYTNTAGGFLGYVPALPNLGGVAGNAYDRVVVEWSTIGKNAPYGPPWDNGRIATHEVGHWLGLWHTFDGGCGDPGRCYTTGDYICDTNPEATPTSGCGEGKVQCGGFESPVNNYMDYTDDACLWEFTIEQNRRMRCTISQWRPLLATIIQPDPFAVDQSTLSLSAGGTMTFDIETSIGMGSWYYLILGSATGTAPALPLGGGVELPLVYDDYFALLLNSPKAVPFPKIRGFLDHNGRAQARLIVPAGVDPSLAGVQLHHAYAATGDGLSFQFASEAEVFTLVP